MKADSAMTVCSTYLFVASVGEFNGFLGKSGSTFFGEFTSHPLDCRHCRHLEREESALRRESVSTDGGWRGRAREEEVDGGGGRLGSRSD